ncbi:MAG: TIM barrel protein [Clostridia bacterium]|nr:TIM barrel protein [Clostridia bacterium]
MNNAYKLGLVSISFRQHNPLEILQAVQKAGLSCIEWGSDVHAPAHEIEKVKEIAALQKQYGIECSSYGTYFRLMVTPMEELLPHIEAAKILGTDILRLWCGPQRSGADLTPAEKEELFDICRQAEKIAAEHGVTLCMECHQNTFTERVSDAVELMQALYSPHFQMYWQPLHDDPAKNVASARAIAPYSSHLHVYNWNSHARYTLADAVDTWRSYVKEFTTPRTLLLEFMPDNRLETLVTEADALRKIIGG